MLSKWRKYPKTSVSLVFILLAIIVSLSYYYYLRSGQTTEEKSITIEVVNENISYYQSYDVITKDKTLGEVLEGLDIAEFVNSSYGRYMTTIDNITVDESNQEWWKFTINGEFAQTGIDDTNVIDGDKYTFIFIIGYE